MSIIQSTLDLIKTSEPQLYLDNSWSGIRVSYKDVVPDFSALTEDSPINHLIKRSVYQHVSVSNDLTVKSTLNTNDVHHDLIRSMVDDFRQKFQHIFTNYSDKLPQTKGMKVHTEHPTYCYLSTTDLWQRTKNDTEYQDKIVKLYNFINRTDCTIDDQVQGVLVLIMLQQKNSPNQSTDMFKKQRRRRRQS